MATARFLGVAVFIMGRTLDAWLERVFEGRHSNDNYPNMTAETSDYWVSGNAPYKNGSELMQCDI